MKYIFWTMLLVNLAYFGYQYPKSTDQKPVVGQVTSATAAGPSSTAIHLLSEQQPPEEERAALTEVITNPVEADDTAGADEGQCEVMGPFTDLFEAQKINEQLTGMGVAAFLKAVDKEEADVDYRVLLPAARSPEEAFRKLRELKAAKIDSYVITQGELALSISLGLFSTREAAEKLIASVKSDGYNAVLHEIKRQTREFWIFTPVTSSLPAPEAPFWQQFVGAEPGIDRRTSICPKNTSSDV